MRDRWTPAPRRTVDAGTGVAVGLGVVTAVLLFAGMTLVGTWLRTREHAGFGTGAFAPTVARDVDVWVGELAPGVKGVLSSEWNDETWDVRQDAVWNRGLKRDAADALAFYSLVVFNTSSAAARVPLGDGSLTLSPETGGAPVPSRSLSALLASPSEAGSPQAAVLRSLGAGQDTLDVPAGQMARRPIAFAGRVDLSTARAVARADGTAFHRRRIPQKTWAGLIHSPSVEDVEDL